MEKYREAYNEDMLKNVHTFKYDNMLYNFVDPKVFEAFTQNKKDGRKNWKKSYGYHYVKHIPAKFVGNTWQIDYYACTGKCLIMENSKFARRCKKDGGYFKCCMKGMLLHTFEESRNRLIGDGLIKGNKSSFCKQDINQCLPCLMDGICTKRNPMTGETVQLFYPRTTPIPIGNINITL